jgi:hypothetical protein
MEKEIATDRAVLRVGNVQFVGLITSLPLMAQHITVHKDTNLIRSFTLTMPRTGFAFTARSIRFVHKMTFVSVGREQGWRYRIFVTTMQKVGLSDANSEIQQCIRYLSQETLFSQIVPATGRKLYHF